MASLTFNGRICDGGARGVLLLLPIFVLRLFDNQTFIKFIDHSSLDLVDALVVFTFFHDKD